VRRATGDGRRATLATSLRRGWTWRLDFEQGRDQALPLSPKKLCAKGLRLSFGSKQAAARQLFPTALKLVRAKRFPIIDIVTHRLSIDDAQKGYELATLHPDDPLAVVFYPSGHQPEGTARALFSSLD